MRTQVRAEAPWRPVALIVVLAGIAVTGAFVALPAGLARDLLYAGWAWIGAGSILLGVRWHQPRQVLPWRLIMVGLSLSALADLLTAVYRARTGQPVGSGAAGAVYVAAYAVLATALARLGRRPSGSRIGGFLDAATLSVGLGLLMWLFVVRPALATAGPHLADRVVFSAYCLGAVLLVTLLLRMVTGPGAGGASYWLLITAAALGLTGVVVYQALAVRLAVAQSWSGACLLLGFTIFTVGALHPSMAQIGEQGDDAEDQAALTPWRLGVLALATLLAPASLAFQLLTGGPDDGWATVCGSALMSLLVLARMADLVRQVRAQARSLAVLADTDPLTGLPNRRAWARELDREISRCARQGFPLGLAVLDLDHFKAYNDTFGHPAGDAALRRVAEAWRSRLRASDLLARLGGEEFAVLLPGCTLAAALVVAEDLRRATPADVTCSLGVACWTGPEDAEQLLARADDALYQAKRDGRDRVAAG